MAEKIILNKEQQEACNHIEGPCVILAGAGSGKTCVVVNRVSYLLNMGVPSSDILAVTFTNKAANELKQRIEKQDLQAPLTVTFHALGVRILRESIHHFGYSNNFQIFDVSDSESLLREIIFQLTGRKEKKLIKEMKGLISHAKTNLMKPCEESCSGMDFSSVQEKKLFLEVYKKYYLEMKNVDAVDFDDLIMLTVFILQDKEWKEKYAARWKFILVDEYQDTNHAQYLICKVLSSFNNNLFVVGDPDQSIYSWRGAKISNILNFEKDFPGAKVITLRQNYRSTGHILSSANHVIGKNTRLYEKDLFSEKGDGEKVEVYSFSNGYDEVGYVVRKIREYIKKGMNPSDIVVFYRTNAQSRMFEDGLMEYGVAYQVVGGLSFYQRREIKDLIGYLRILALPSDVISFSRVINLPKRGVGKKTVEKLMQASRENDCSIIDAVKQAIEGNLSFTLTKNAKEGLKSFIIFYDHMMDLMSKGILLAELITEVYSSSLYEKVLLVEKESMQDRVENIDELISKADSYDKRKDSSLQRFLEDVCLNVEDNQEDRVIDKVSLMTIHNAKGLEFEGCFIVGLEEDIFPHVRSKHSMEELEEERRLFYVGMTRAKKHLTITFVKRRFIWGSEKILQPSRFVRELPSAHILGRENKESCDEEKDFSIGSFVFHKTFGRGVIDKVYETSYGETYDILFSMDNQKRTLIAKYAKLESAE